MWYFIIAVFCCSSLWGQTSSPVLVFEERVFDFGEIEEAKGKVNHTFIFKNESDKSVVITGVRSGCGCIASEYTAEPIPVGGKGKVTVTFDPKYRPGFFSKEVVVMTNQGNQRSRIWVKGTVLPMKHPVEEDYPYHFGDGLFLNRKVLALGKVKKGTSKQIELGYTNDTNQSMNLTFLVEENKSHLIYTNPGEVVANGRGKIVFTYQAPKHLNGEIRFPVYPVINGNKVGESILIKCVLQD